MKTKTIQKTAFVFIVAVLLSGLAGMAALSIDFGSAKIDLDDTTKATNRYLPVPFDHKTHIEGYGISCVTCHHKEKESFVSGSTPLCSSCHNAEGTVSNVSFKEAMHKRCVVCHITENKAGKKAPTECLACHTQRP
jgi:predicted CXXCH cytochrome family protein